MSETEELALYHQTLKATTWAPHNVGEDPFSFAHRSLLEGDPRKERAQNGKGINATDMHGERKSKSYNQVEEVQNGLKEESVEEKGGLKCRRDGQEKKVVNKRKVKIPARRTYLVDSEVDCLVKRYKQNGDLDVVSDTDAEPLLHRRSPPPQPPQHSQHTTVSPRLPSESSALLKEPHQQLLLSSQNSSLSNSTAPDPKPSKSTKHSGRLSSSPILSSSLSQPQSPRPLHKQQQHDVTQKPRHVKQQQEQQLQDLLKQSLRSPQTLVHPPQQLPGSPKLPSRPGSPKSLPASSSKQPGAPIPIRSPRQSLMPGSPRLSPLPPLSPINLPRSPINLPWSPTSSPQLPRSLQQQIPALLPLDLTTTSRSSNNNHQYSHSSTFLPSHPPHSHASTVSSPSHSSSPSPSHRHHHSQPKSSSPCFQSHCSPSDHHHSHFSSTQVYPYDFSLPTQRNCHSLSPPPNRSGTPVSPPTRQKCHSVSPPTQSTSNTSSSHSLTQYPSSSSRSSKTQTSLSTTSALSHSNTATQSSSRYSPTREDLEEEISRKKKACEVCGDVARSLHFGGRVCDSCKAFFRRAVLSQAALSFVCSHQGRCIITLTTRRSCQACRFTRCVQAGMEVSLVAREDEASRTILPPTLPSTPWTSPLWHPHLPHLVPNISSTVPDALKTCILSSSTLREVGDTGKGGSNPTSAGVGSAPKAISRTSTGSSCLGTELGPKLSSEDSKEVQQLREAYFQAFERVAVPLGESDIQCEELGQIYTHFVERRAHFLVSTPHYHTLAPADRPRQLHIAVAMSTYFTGAHLIDTSDFTWRKHRVGSEAARAPLVLTATTMRQVLSHQQFTHVMRFYTKFSNVLADQTVAILMQVMSLFYHDPGVVPPPAVEAGRRHYSSLLARYLVTTVGAQQASEQLATLLVCQHEARQLVGLLQHVDLAPATPQAPVQTPTATLLTNLHQVVCLVQTAKQRKQEGTTITPGTSHPTSVNVEKAEQVMGQLARCNDPATLASARAILPTTLLSRLLHLLQHPSSARQSPQSPSQLALDLPLPSQPSLPHTIDQHREHSASS